MPCREKASCSSWQRHIFAIVFRRPAQQAEKVDKSFGQKSGVAIGGDAHDRSVAALGELGSVGRNQQWQMGELRRRTAGGFENQNMLVGV